MPLTRRTLSGGHSAPPPRAARRRRRASRRSRHRAPERGGLRGRHPRARRGSSCEPSGSPTKAVSRSPVVRGHGVRADRRVAGGVERAHERALGRQARERVAVGERAAALGRRRSSAGARLEREAALPGRGHHVLGVERACPRRSRPSRSRPACASTIASKSPSASRRRRVSTLPRSSRTSRSGRSASSAARRRRLAVPDDRALGQLVERAGAAERVARVGALGHAHDREPVGQLGGHVLGRVHGEVDLAGQQRLLDLLHEARLVGQALGGQTRSRAGARRPRS